MQAAVAPLLAALRERGTAPFLAYADRDVSAAEVLGCVEDAVAEAGKLRPALVPGCVAALRGDDPGLRIAAPLAAWSLGLCAQPLSDREPDAAVEGLLHASGARVVFAWRPQGRWSLEPRSADLDVALPTGTLFATSGSAGRPKLVVHGLEQHLASARGACAFLDLGPHDRLLLSLPTWHVGGMGIVLRAILAGSVLCVPAAGESLAAALLRSRPTCISLVATQLAGLLEDAQATEALRACRSVLLGGGPLTLSQRERALDAGLPIVVSYGATETSAFVAASAEPGVILRPQSAGCALPERDVQIDDEGQICVGGPTLFDGYLVDGQVRPERNVAGLWATGDTGRIEDGVLYVHGRGDRMFISGGENVQPEEIEGALLAIDGVDEAVVVGVAHEAFGARPAAFVRGAALDASVLDQALRRVLPGFKVPDVYYRMPAGDASRMKPDLARLQELASDPGDLERL